VPSRPATPPVTAVATGESDPLVAGGGRIDTSAATATCATEAAASTMPRDAVREPAAGPSAVRHPVASILGGLPDSAPATEPSAVRNPVPSILAGLPGGAPKIGPNANRVASILAGLPGGAPATEPRRNIDMASVIASNGSRTTTDPTNVSRSAALARPPASPLVDRATLPKYLREDGAGFRPSEQTIAACLANPEAIAALNAGDPLGFARAMGVAVPCDDYLKAAAARGSPFDVSGSRAPPANPPTRKRET
jgi:hypothetical protein